MNVNLQANACDPARVELFLSGDLTSAQQREFTLHLNTCENCRRSLHEQAAEPEAWIEAEQLLKPSEFDSFNADEFFASGIVEPSARPPIQIQNVINALAPTDDPQMLGRLGGYEISGVVGAGGMGVVLKAIDKSLDRTVAIKVLAPHLAASGAARKRFAREAKAAAAVLHPNVIAIHSVSNDEALPYLVMPYLRGTSLQKRLDEEGPLSLHEILRIGSQIAAGLAAAHAQGLVHRDIKPANILLEQGVERVTITDFGLARAVDDATITHSGVIAGTPQYMSPEQARGEPVDGRSDLFSLGSVLYAICTGRPPFRAETTHGVMRRITDDEPTPIREINPDIPDWLCSIIGKLMAKKATDRFESAAEVTQLLEECLAHVQQPAAVPLPHIPYSLPEKTASQANRTTKRYRKGVIAMIATLGFLGMALWLSADAPDISGRWTGEEWGEVALEQKEPGTYHGTYSDTFGKEVGGLELTWSRIERRFKGTWREGKNRFGKISVRMVGDEIRGAWTTNDASRIQPGNPELADLTWKRTGTKSSAATSTAVAPSPARASSEIAFGPVVEKILVHDGKTGTPSVFLDLDTGRSASMELKAGRKKIFRWAREAGMDLEFTGFSPNVGLLGWRLLVRAVDEGKWDKTNANELLNEPALADNMRRTRSTGDALSPSITDPNEWDLFDAPRFFKSGTYYFRTNEDGRGILQVSVSEEPHGVRIRYKLLQRPDQKRDSVSNGDSTAPTQPAKPETPAVGSPVNAVDPPSPPATVLTASQVVEQGNALYHSRKKVTVRFRVESATQISQRDEQGKESKRWNLSSKAASDRVDPTAFSVLLSPEAEAALVRHGVSNIARHYFGTLIEVEGVVYGVGLDLVSQPKTTWTYHMDVNSLEQIQIRAVDPPPSDYLSAPSRAYSTPAETIEIDVRKVARRIEALKSKFPHLKNFFADRHLRENEIKNGFAPGTASNPELYSITYHNGVTAAEVPKTGLRRSPKFVYDPETGIQLDIHFFEGDSRGADRTLPYRIGDLSIHVYVKGPAAEPIRGEIVRILQELGSEQGPPVGAIEAPSAPPLPVHPPRNSADGDPNRNPGKPLPPTVPDPLPGSSDRPADTWVPSGVGEPKATAATPGRMNYFTSGHSISIASSADGKLIAVANANPTRILMEGGTSRVKGAWKPTVDILEIDTGKVVVSSTITDRDENAVLAATPRISHFEVTALAFSPVENLLAVGTSIGQVKLFDARTGRLIQSFDDEQAKHADKNIPENWKALRFAMGHVGSLAFSSDGTLLAMCGSSFSDSSDGFDGVERLTRKTTGPGRVKVWDVKTAKLKHDLVGHSYANTVAFSSDGNLLASAGSWLASGGDGHGSGVIIWNPQTGAKLRTITNEANLGTRSAAFLPDSETVLICSDNYDKEGATTTATISLANAATGTIQRQHKVPGGASKVLSPDGKTILVLTGKSIQFLDAETGTVKRKIKSDNLSKDGQLGDFALLRPWLVIGTVDDEEGNVELWNLGDDLADATQSSETKVRILSMGSSSFMLDLDTGNTMPPAARTGNPEQGKMDLHTDQVQPYHYPTKLIGVGLIGREVKASDWNASAADVRRALAGNTVGPLKQMDLGPEQNPTYFFKTRDGAYGVLQLLGIVEEPKGIRLRYKILGDRAASGAQKGTAVSPGVAEKKEPVPAASQPNVTPGPGPDARPDPRPKANSTMPKRTYHLPAGDMVETIAVAPDGSLIAFGNGNPTLIEHTNRTIEVTDNWKPSVKIAAGEPHFGERGVSSLNLTTPEERAVLAATARVSYFEVTALAFSPDASLLAVGTSIGQVKLFNTKTAELVRVLDDERARLTDKDTPENWKSLKRALGSVASLAFSPDGSLLAMCGTSFEDYSDIFDGIERTTLKTTGPGRLKVFEVKTGTLNHDLVGHSHVYDVAFSPEGDLLASAGSWDNGTGVITWNAQTGKKVSTIVKEANAGVQMVAFSPTRKMVAIGARLYDKENDTYSTAISVAFPMSGIMEWSQIIPGHALPKDFSPNGKTVALLCGGESIRFIDVETGQLKHEIKAADSPGRGRWTDFAIAPKGQLLVIGRADGEHKGSVEIWEFNDPAAADE